jgi:uncharacterized membrane protein YhaH (DUF805 family)
MMRLPRLRRRGYWLLTLIAWLAFCVLLAVLDAASSGATGVALAAVQVLLLGTFTAARLRDRNRGAWALAAVLIPLLGPLWLFWEAACRRGTRGSNRYGPDPHRS